MRRIWAVIGGLRNTKLLLRAILGVLLIACLAYYNLPRPSSKSPKLQSVKKTRSKTEKYAYASLLCDDVMIDAVKVLIHSLKATGTPYPFLLLILPGVTQTDDLVRLGAELHRITPLDYPFRVSAEKAAINKMCRYSKLHIWRFTHYKKIVFVDVDTLIRNNIDAVFRWPEFSAVKDAGDTYNTGLFVLEPSLSTFKRMSASYFTAPSYNQGDQGFLNWFFRDSPRHSLPVRYNTVAKIKAAAAWPLIRHQARMLHFTSETKPWNFFAGAHRFWRQNYDPLMFYEWTAAYRNVSKLLHIDAHNPGLGQWSNAGRVGSVCAKAVTWTKDSKDLDGNKLSIVINKWSSIAGLETALFHYRRVVGPVVAKVYISWLPSQGTPPAELAKYRNARDPPVEIILHPYESVGAALQPLPGLLTKAVLLTDDEYLPDLERLEIALESFKGSPWSLIGFFARFHSKQRIVDFEIPSLHNNITSENSQSPQHLPYYQIAPGDQRYQWSVNATTSKRPRPYSILAGSVMLVNHEYLFAYTCLLPERIHRFLDEQDDDGSDLALNLLASGMSGARPLLIKSDMPDADGARLISSSDAGLSKGRLLQEFSKLFIGVNGRDPLIYNNVVVAQFNKIPFRKRSIKRWNDP